MFDIPKSERIMEAVFEKKIKIYYFMVVLSLVLSAASFSYNAWRMEVSEANNNRRMASFELIKVLAELEQNLYAAYYDKDDVSGSPRIAWVKVGAVKELSFLTDKPVQKEAEILSELWAENWARAASEQSVIDAVVAQIEEVRLTIRHQLESLK